jgi:hypothetical protein
LDGKSEFLTNTDTDANIETSAESDRAHDHVLDRVVAASLEGHHARFARRHGRAVRYENDVTPFFAIEDAHDPAAWDDAAELLDDGETAAFPGISTYPSEWELIAKLDGVQMVGTNVSPKLDPEAIRLGPHDVPEILDLISRTEPGPFLQRTIELGTYLGIRRDGALIAMAGERMHPPGWTEISAVCTDPAYRGQGLSGTPSASRGRWHRRTQRDPTPTRGRHERKRHPPLPLARIHRASPDNIPAGAKARSPPAAPYSTRLPQRRRHQPTKNSRLVLLRDARLPEREPPGQPWHGKRERVPHVGTTTGLGELSDNTHHDAASSSDVVNHPVGRPLRPHDQTERVLLVNRPKQPDPLDRRELDGPVRLPRVPHRDHKGVELNIVRRIGHVRSDLAG